MPSAVFSALRRRFCLLALIAPLALPSGAQAAHPVGPNPFRGRQLFVDCENGWQSGARPFSAWGHVFSARGSSRALLERIARVPGTKWFAGIDSTSRLRRQAERFLAAVDHPQYGGSDCRRRLSYSGDAWAAGPVGARDPYVGSYPVMALRAMKHSRCRGWSGGPWNTTAAGGAYRRWVRAFVAELGRTYASDAPYVYFDSAPQGSWRPYRARQAAVIIEPDAMALTGRRSSCLTAAGKSRRLANLRYAVDRLATLRDVETYIDAGSSDWMTASEAVKLLRAAGVGKTRGFALNATAFNRTAQERAFGNRIARAVNRHFVINTAENGRGPSPRSFWGKYGPGAKTCNPPSAGLGQPPTTRTGSPWADALLWISRPGLSSNRGNRCHRGPRTNVWWNVQALGLARRAADPTPPWPPGPL